MRTLKELTLIGCLVLWPALVWAGNYTSSIHGSSTAGVLRNSIYNIYSTISRGNCLNCHEMHASLGGSEPAPAGGAPDPFALFAFEEDVCFYCHTATGSGQVNPPPGFKDLKGLFTDPANVYGHPVTDPTYSGRHVKPAYWETSADLQNRHSECVDCHNPHTVKQDTHTMGSPPAGYTSARDNNRVSGVLRGVFGVEPNWSTTNWTVPTSFNELRPTKTNPAAGAEREYQICLKCHSYYGLANVENTGTGVTNITGASGEVLTDQALEFSPYNYSGHPVVVAADDRIGGYGFTNNGKRLSPSSNGNRLKYPWDTNVGQQTMYCSDCHGEDASTEIKGPHASSAKFVLVDGRTWPKKSTTCNGNDFWTLSDIKNDLCNWQTELLCAKCHVLKTNSGKFLTNSGKFLNGVHAKGDHQKDYIECINCHMAVPHGSHASRLIVYVSDPAPYDYQDSYARLDGFCKSSDPDQYDKKYCYSTFKECDDHKGYSPGSCPSGTYDP